MIQEKWNTLISWAGTCFLSVVSYGQGYDMLGIASTLFGVVLTGVTIYGKIEDIKYRRLERRKLEAELGK